MQATTLYKTAGPTRYRSEYYEIAFMERLRPEGQPLSEPLVYTYIEYHGWWDEEQERPIHNQSTISPSEGVSSEEAERWYHAQIQHRAREGFIYAFTPNPFGYGPSVIKVEKGR